MNGTASNTLNDQQIHIINSLKEHCSRLLDTSCRFKYFTLHGRQHIDNIFRVLNILIEGGLYLTSDQLFLLSCAICTHDIGMVTPLSHLDNVGIFLGNPQPSDPSKIDGLIRSMHHELVDDYIDNHFDFLSSNGLTVSQCSLISEISKCHRKKILSDQGGFIASLGSLLRVMDELDIFPSRAPIDVFIREYKDMDATSCWHWFKHNICEEWMIGHNVRFERNAINKIVFTIAVHPSKEDSIPYWLNNIAKPISKELLDEGAGKIIIDNFGIQIIIEQSQDLSKSIKLNSDWLEIEQKCLSAGRKVILFVDDEVRKMEDLFIPLMQKYHVIYSSNTKDALEKLSATNIDLAIIDLQIGSGYSWSSEETEGFKMTGLKLCKEIYSKHKNTKVGILTGSRYDLSKVREIEELSFLIKKPVDPEYFEKEVTNVLK